MPGERWFYALPLTLRTLFRRRQADEELDEEIRYHLEQQIQEHIAKGLTPELARTTVLRAFGGVERRKEECRDMRRLNFVDNLRKDNLARRSWGTSESRLYGDCGAQHVSCLGAKRHAAADLTSPLRHDTGNHS
jgi:hypothetical protein